MKLLDPLPIPLLTGPLKADHIRIPGSKSISNRALLIAALAEGETELHGLLTSVDTERMIACTELLGAEYPKGKRPRGGRLLVRGLGGRLKPCAETLQVENAGTAARFLTAALTLGEGNYRLDGNERMRQRPIQDLIDALSATGVKIRSAKKTGCPPVEVEANGFPGGKMRIPGDQSSQYLSALLMVAPYAQRDTVIEIQGNLVSATYVEMTQLVMADFGVKLHWNQPNLIEIPAGQGYKGRSYGIEGDASSASYFFALGAISGEAVILAGCKPDSTQGDLGLLTLLEEMGCMVEWSYPKDKGILSQNDITPLVAVSGGPLQAIEVDMNSMSDVAPTLAVVAMFAQGQTRIKNVANMRIKECDRLYAVAKELSKLGVKVQALKGDEVLPGPIRELQKGESFYDAADGLAIMGDPSCKSFHGAELDTYDDHRMAMALSLAGLKVPGVKIKNPACVEKTFPTYWEELHRFVDLGLQP